MQIGIGRLPRISALLYVIVLAALSVSAAAAQNVGGYTNMSYGPGHGTQIEYVARDGKTYLWYPGNRVILAGRWKLDGADMCFAYGENTYNPVTGTHGGGWECEPVRAYQSGVVERMQGDPLGLAGRSAAPFRLDRGQTTLGKVLARISPGAGPAPVEAPANAPSGAAALSCQSIIANAERSKGDMATAAGTYFHGIFMGKPCVDVDYARAFDLARRAGQSVEPFLRILRERAATGNPRAISALKLLEP